VAHGELPGDGTRFFAPAVDLVDVRDVPFFAVGAADVLLEEDTPLAHSAIIPDI
jgi:hypothetical protein